MKMKALRVVPMFAVLAAFVSTLIPFGPAGAQWVFLARGPGEDSTASRVLQAVLRVCKEMNKECQVGG
jgi:hypothetical protein